MSAHQATLDYVNQPLQTCGTEDGQRGRYEHNQFAEDQGDLNHQWLSLQETLNTQVFSCITWASSADVVYSVIMEKHFITVQTYIYVFCFYFLMLHRQT